MYAIFMSSLLKAEFDSNPEKFKVERFYKKEFTIEHISDDDAKKWQNAVFNPNNSGHSLKLGYPPPNKFMPNLYNLKPKKAERANAQEPNKPK